MTPIARALTRETPAERLAVGIYISTYPLVAQIYANFMLGLALKLEFGVAPATQGRG